MTTKGALKAWATRRGDPAYRDREAERQDDIVAAAEAVVRLVRYRDIEPGPSWVDPGNDQEFRYILSAIVRRWNPGRPGAPVDFKSFGSHGKRKLHREHVVPVEIIVSRMIKDPSECRALLENAVVIAHVTPAEHTQLGNLWTDHPELNAKMLTAPVKDLARLGRQRYADRGVELKEAPS